MDKKSLSERDICSKYIAPAIQHAGWDMHKQVREEVSFTKGRIMVRASFTAGAKHAVQTSSSTTKPTCLSL